jgi:hypothetical protein
MTNTTIAPGDRVVTVAGIPVKTHDGPLTWPAGLAGTVNFLLSDGTPYVDFDRGGSCPLREGEFMKQDGN